VDVIVQQAHPFYIEPFRARNISHRLEQAGRDVLTKQVRPCTGDQYQVIGQIKCYMRGAEIGRLGIYPGHYFAALGVPDAVKSSLAVYVALSRADLVLLVGA